jgi:hypothetical protein
MKQYDECDLSVTLCINCYKNLINGIEICKGQASADKIKSHVSMLKNMNDTEMAELLAKNLDNLKFENENDNNRSI